MIRAEAVEGPNAGALGKLALDDSPRCVLQILYKHRRDEPMFEICRLLRAPKKARKPRKPARKSIRIGARVMVGTKVYIVAARDTKYASAWYLDNLEGVRMPFSVSRDMIAVL